MQDYPSLFLVPLLPALLFAFGGLFLWLTWRQRYGVRQRTTGEMLERQLFLLWHTHRVEIEVAEALKELDWRKAAKQMTEREVAILICNRLVDHIWSRPNGY